MKQPTKAQLNEIKNNPPGLDEMKSTFDKLVKHNLDRKHTYGRHAGDGAFTVIADKCEMTSRNVKHFLKFGVKNWKDRHFTVWFYSMQYVKKC